MKINLQKYGSEDFNSFKTLVCEDALMKYISGNGLNENQARAKFDRILEINSKELELGYFKVLTDENEFVGDCKLERYKHDESILEIGYIIKKNFWRNGIGSLICRKLLDVAHNLYPDLAVIGIIDPENMASKKLLDKFGFESYFIGIEDDLPTEKLILKKLQVDE
ncbi:GNAT family N-acetyltransferase [Sphingobacterium anhuiense]|uniref:GNAT family N-acetyltransferase n=1 Tax=Sphingobacterium anhuiense TaxID=493780 RepID=A0ABW5YU99_9SPHI